jgi:DNA-3-methyladenine glycosylase
MSGNKLPREFFQRDALQLAHDLLGCALTHATPEGLITGIIVETEAYRGPADAAAHSFRGKRTARTEVMYGPAGHAYIYLIYGMYECLNVVGGEIDNPEAVLIRALEPVAGVEQMARRRKVDLTGPRSLRQLCSGPGKLTQALGITRAEHYGIDLCGEELYITSGRKVDEDQIATTPRINVDYAGEWRDLPWRYIVKDSPHLSRPWRGA